MIKKIIRNPYVWAFFIGIISLHIIKECAMNRRQAAEPLADVADWNLLNHENKIFGQKDLLGKVVIGDFFFTSCPSICPKLTEAMKELQLRFKNNTHVAFVSISVDPEVDTPEHLQSFMRKNNIVSPNWYFLAARTKKQIYDVVVEKMHVHMGDREPVAGAPEVYDIPHMAHLALFDQKGRLRGLFKTDSIEMAALVRAAHFLIEKPD